MNVEWLQEESYSQQAFGMWDLQQLGRFRQLGVHQLLGEMEGGTCMFASKWCRELARLVGEVEDLMHTMGSMKRICEGVMAPDNHSTEGNRKGKDTAGRQGYPYRE